MTKNDRGFAELDNAMFERLEEAVVRAADYLRHEADRIATVAGTDAADDNPHTNLDLEVDELLKASLEEVFTPGAHWVSEEHQPPDGRRDARFCFVVDPIDGTRNVLQGRPEACVSVALWERDAGIIWGCIHNPFTAETFTAVRGRGSRLNGKPIAVSTQGNPGAALYLVSVHESVKGMLDAVRSEIRTRPVGSIAYKMCLIACGQGDATFTINPRHDWDIAAGLLIVQEAGGEVSDSRGGAVVMNSESLRVDGVIVTNGLIHANTVAVCRTLRDRITAMRAGIHPVE